MCRLVPRRSVLVAPKVREFAAGENTRPNPGYLAAFEDGQADRLRLAERNPNANQIGLHAAEDRSCQDEG